MNSNNTNTYNALYVIFIRALSLDKESAAEVQEKTQPRLNIYRNKKKKTFEEK